MDKDDLRRIVEQVLFENGLDEEEAEMIADTMIDRCDEEGLFEVEEDLDSNF